MIDRKDLKVACRAIWCYYVTIV